MRKLLIGSAVALFASFMFAGTAAAKPLKSCTAALDAAETVGTKSELYIVNARRCRQGINSAEKATAAKAGPYKPVPTDFELAVITLEQSCFGSAGCNVTYRIDITYVGSQSPDPKKTFRVVYDVRGGDDPEVGSFEVTGDRVSFASEERISTPPNPVLTAVVTSVV